VETAESYTVEIDSAPSDIRTEDDALRFHEELELESVALGPACSLHVPTGVVSATFVVEADSIANAAEDGFRAATDAFARARVHTRVERLGIEYFKTQC
jgi:hypothetical protein